ncbi:hypothetical protein CS542_02155 [Pedobacter sp. IW39]|nr:hypothetical protein CS542_02155 [Pedobacter sp. IW39]
MGQTSEVMIRLSLSFYLVRAGLMGLSCCYVKTGRLTAGLVILYRVLKMIDGLIMGLVCCRQDRTHDLSVVECMVNKKWSLSATFVYYTATRFLSVVSIIRITRWFLVYAA